MTDLKPLNIVTGIKDNTINSIVQHFFDFIPGAPGHGITAHSCCKLPAVSTVTILPNLIEWIQNTAWNYYAVYKWLRRYEMRDRERAKAAARELVAKMTLRCV